MKFIELGKECMECGKNIDTLKMYIFHIIIEMKLSTKTVSLNMEFRCKLVDIRKNCAIVKKNGSTKFFQLI